MGPESAIGVAIMTRRDSAIDLKWMDRALELAERGRYTVSPNPMVGAVLVKAGRIVGEGFHERAGGRHAEAVALAAAGKRARGADLYVTLEPCSHFGRTPPCAEALLESGVSRVVVAARDPNPLVSGRGWAALSRGGIEVAHADADRRRRAERQNEKFRVWIEARRPFVLAKWAQTLDGKIAAAEGGSRWITGPQSRKRALLLREECDAVLVGANTVIADDPLLTRRMGRNRGTRHWRIVLDGRLRVSEKARLFQSPEGTVVVTRRPPGDAGVRRLVARGIRVWSLPGRRGRVSVPRLLQRLAREGVASLLVEGGGETLWQFFRAGRVDRVAVFLAPRILGGAEAPGAVGGQGFSLRSTPRLRDVEVEPSGEDLFLTGRVSRNRGARH
jgi:diaminohydroxyphosphoribosylaminopyrimidine deaminase / 5-amino-6-(5-phosphoribosylamino)uracil reductase